MLRRVGCTLAIYYVAINLCCVGLVTRIHKSELVLDVKDGCTAEQIPFARLLDEGTDFELARADSNGTVHCVVMVQDQGWWAFPPLGVRANLSGRKYSLKADHYEDRTISIPGYSGQILHLVVTLDRKDPGNGATRRKE